MDTDKTTIAVKTVATLIAALAAGAIWIAGIAFIATIAVVITAVRAWSALVLWGWFVNPTWPQLGTPTFVEMGGVLLLLLVMMPNHPQPLKKENWRFHLMGALFPVIAVGLGWLWRWWFGV